MQELPSNLSASITTIDINSSDEKETKHVPVLNVLIADTPSIIQIKHLMDNIRELSSSILGDYIAVTDLSKLSINTFFRSLILQGMETAYKSFISVPHQARISFVILGDDDKRLDKLITASLKRINDDIAKQDYEYNYFFIQNNSQVPEIVKNYYDKFKIG